MSEAPSIESQINAALDEALEKLRWCRDHMTDVKASQQLRDVEVKMGYLAMALSWQMDGEQEQAETALRMARGGVRYETIPVWNDEFWWSH